MWSSEPPVEEAIPGRLDVLPSVPADFGAVSVPANANPSIPSRTPADLSADMAPGSSGHADTINPYPTRTARFADLRDHTVRLMKRRRRHCLRRRCDGQSKNNSDYSNHWFLSCLNVSWLSAARFDHNFGQALPIMESNAALASSIVAYLPNSLYLAVWVEGSSLPGMTRHCLVVLSSTT